MTTLAAVGELLSPPQTEAVIARLVSETRRIQESLVRGTSNAYMAGWMESGRHLATVDEIGVWTTGVARGAQQSAYEITAASIAEHVSLAKGVPIAPVSVSTESAVWMMTPESYAARSAGIVMRQQLGAGVPWEVATSAAGRVGAGRVAALMQDAMRQAGTDWNRSQPPANRSRGWRKVTSGAACGWCLMVADQVYKNADSVAKHDADRCGFAPVVDGDGWSEGRLADAGTDWDELRKQKADPEAATIPEPTTDDVEVG